MRLEKRKTVRVEEEKEEKDEMDILKAVECLHANINRIDEQYSCHSKLKSKLEKIETNPIYLKLKNGEALSILVPDGAHLEETQEEISLKEDIQSLFFAIDNVD